MVIVEFQEHQLLDTLDTLGCQGSVVLVGLADKVANQERVVIVDNRVQVDIVE